MIIFNIFATKKKGKQDIIDPVDLNKYFSNLSKALADVPWCVLLSIDGVESIQVLLKNRAPKLPEGVCRWAAFVIHEYMIQFSTNFNFMSLENSHKKMKEKMSSIPYVDMQKRLSAILSEAFVIAGKARVYLGLIRCAGTTWSPFYEKEFHNEIKLNRDSQKFAKMAQKESELLEKFIAFSSQLEELVFTLDNISIVADPSKTLLLVIGKSGELKIEERNLMRTERLFPDANSRVVSFFGNLHSGKSFFIAQMLAAKENPNHRQNFTELLFCFPLILFPSYFIQSLVMTIHTRSMCISLMGG